MRVWYRGDRSRDTDVTICPAGHLPGVLPRSWYEEDGSPRTMTVQFRAGYTDVSDEVGRYLIDQNYASRTSLIMPR